MKKRNNKNIWYYMDRILFLIVILALILLGWKYAIIGKILILMLIILTAIVLFKIIGWADKKMFKKRLEKVVDKNRMECYKGKIDRDKLGKRIGGWLEENNENKKYYKEVNKVMMDAIIKDLTLNLNGWATQADEVEAIGRGSIAGRDGFIRYYCEIDGVKRNIQQAEKAIKDNENIDKENRLELLKQIKVLRILYEVKIRGIANKKWEIKE